MVSRPVLSCSAGRPAHATHNRSDLSVPEREEYIRAVLCLMSKPAKAPKDQFPGAVSRFDDFLAFHMTQAPALHSPVRIPCEQTVSGS